MAVTVSAVEAAAEILGPVAARDQPLGPLTTYRVGGPAALLARPRTVAELALVGAARAASGLPVLVVGRGSNLLVADTGFPGIAVSVADLAADIEVLDAGRPHEQRRGSTDPVRRARRQRFVTGGDPT